MNVEFELFLLFCFVVVGFLALDLGYFNRKAHRISTKSALIQSFFWIAISIAFAFIIVFAISKEAAAEFMSAYMTEKMLSIDNLLVIALIFNFFKLEEKYFHKVLFWGIMGAIVFRGIFIGVGAMVIAQFHWVLYIFGALLIYTGIKLLVSKKEEHVDLSKNKVLKLVQKYLPFTTEEHEGKFVKKVDGKWMFTTLMLIVLMVETMDIVFAIDSIPAAFSITQDMFIVFTSNIFAIMGLRALFFLLESVLHRFRHIQKGLAFVLVFVGVKMLLDIIHIEISSFVSFAVIMLAFTISILASLVKEKEVVK